MTAILQPEPKSPSRRAVLAAALGGAAAMVARTVIQPTPARAAGDDSSPILVGSNFLDVRTGTYLSDSETAATVFSAVSSSASGHGNGVAISGASGSGTGVHGESDSGFGVKGHSDMSVGVYGESPSGRGVAGVSTSNVGVVGTSTSSVGVHGVSGSDRGVHGESTSNVGVVDTSTSSIGVHAYSLSTSQPANLGQSFGNSTGVQGYSGGGSLPAAKAKTGVYGYAAQDSSSKGVYGESPSGYAGYFAGKVYTTRFHELTEISTPAAPGTNKARLFARVNSSGKTQLCVRFQSGAVQVIKSEP